MKCTRMIFIAILLSVVTGCAMNLEMNPPQTVNLMDAKQHPYSAGLFIPKETRMYTYVQEATLINNDIIYPLGQQTTLALRKNLPQIFKEVVEVESLNPPQSVKVIIQPSVIDFKANVPYPAYNPYEASIMYRIDVYNRKGEKIFTQTVTGEGQTSRGLLSGFVVKSLFAEAAQMAIDKAIQQIIEGLASAEELKEGN